MSSNTPAYLPRYLNAYETGQLSQNVKLARRILSACTLCPRRCLVNRLDGESGICKTGEQAILASFSPHFGEEAPLVGTKGSGTVFFSNCSLLCKFCQNFEISHWSEGRPISDSQLACVFLTLQDAGCHNINLVTPTHVVPQILAALEMAIPKGLSIPLVYNTSGYEQVETLALLDNVVDIYMPDFKFWDASVARDACNASDYPQKTRLAILEMFRQVGDLVLGAEGIAVCGLLVRHLVLPGGLAGTRAIMKFLATEVSPNTYVNIMDQYRPCGNAHEIAGFAQSLLLNDYADAVNIAKAEGIWRLDRR